MIKNQRSFVSKNSNSLNDMIKKTSMTSKQLFRNKQILIVIVAVFAISLLVSVTYAGTVYSDHGPKPWSGHKKDTMIWHIQPENGANADCGGHSLHIGAEITNPGQIVNFIHPTNVTVSMKDWDGTLNGGNETKTIDCDSRDGDGKVSFQIADHDPRKGWVTTSDWYMRLVGMPEQNFTATTYANHTISCTDDDFDGQFDCNFDIVKLAHIDLAQEAADAEAGDPCKDAFKQKGNGKRSQGGFCDVTSATEVDVTLPDDTVVEDQQIFSVSCQNNEATNWIDEDDPDGINDDNDCTDLATETEHYRGDPLDGNADKCYNADGTVRDDRLELEGEDPSTGASTGVDDDGDAINETLDVCPLGSSIWEIDQNTGRPTVQMFIVHSDEGVEILEGKKINKGNGRFK
jgi:hypothetical protein